MVATPAQVKVEGLKAKLLDGPTRAATVVISAQRPDAMVSVRPALERFARALGPIDAVIEAATVETK